MIIIIIIITLTILICAIPFFIVGYWNYKDNKALENYGKQVANFIREK